MKQIRLYLGAILVLSGLILTPLAFAKDILTDALDSIGRARLNACISNFNACTNQCSAFVTSVPGYYGECMQKCASQYTHCTSRIASQAPKRPSPSITPRPSIAPLNDKSRKSQADRTDKPVTTTITPRASTVKPSATPKPKTKQDPGGLVPRK